MFEEPIKHADIFGMRESTAKIIAGESDKRTPSERFGQINRERMSRMRDSLPGRQSMFIDLLPLLLHVNHAQLPGYISTSTPAGIHDYAPSSVSLAAAQKLTRSFSSTIKMARHHELLGIYLMGSCGSIAHSDNSDFDVWLCHAAGIEDQRLIELREKAAAIETWALSLNVEAHFFVFDPAQFKTGVNEQLSSESSGSTQHYLLLDEFYRSGLVVAGLLPMWFEVPSEQEHRYDDRIAELTRLPDGQHRVHVDFGGVGHVPTEEFFGATLWQLYKSIHSPFKSVLKLLLMEVYATDFPNCDLLSLQFKRAVYAGETGLLALDPYLLMYQRVEAYLLGQQDETRLDMLRRCFYLKIGEPLSAQNGHKRHNWRRDKLRQMVNQWGWSAQKIALLDNKKFWQLDAVIRERRDLVSTITQAYRMLSRFARRHVELSRISEADLVILGRKLYIAFERKPGKVELVNRGIVDTLLTTEATLAFDQEKDKDKPWNLLPGRQTHNVSVAEGIQKQGACAFELLCWGYFNKVINRQTHIVLSTPGSEFSLREVQAILGLFEKLYPDAELDTAATSDLTTAPRLKNACLFVNVGVEPLKGRLADGRHLASARNNALSYGGKYQNLALTFDTLFETTWGELSTSRYIGISGLFDCLRDYLRWSPPSRGIVPPELQVYTFYSSYAHIISQSLTRLVRALLKAFYPSRTGRIVRYVVDVENRHWILSSLGDELTSTECPSFAALMKQLNTSSNGYVHTVIDEQSLRTTLLPVLYASKAPGIIDMFLLTANRLVEIYVIDENGALYSQVIPYYDIRILLQQFMLFFRAVNRRRYIATADTATPFRDPTVKIHAIVKGANNERTLRQLSYNYENLPRTYFNIQVTIRPGVDSDRTVVIYCNNQEFSSVRLGNNIFPAVAKHILSMREHNQPYPIYITDIDITPELLGQSSERTLQTIDFLNFKKLIEDRLNEAIDQTAP